MPQRITVATILGPITVEAHREDLAWRLADQIGARRVIDLTVAPYAECDTCQRPYVHVGLYWDGEAHTGPCGTRECPGVIRARERRQRIG